ncbi:metallophosphoesterase [uncultured Sphingomonas sp.]|uniref:metallophosphoesterase n=1 Tax=uncultured Sphingomonas sp. TaxID=158754 RepID=UPI0035C9E49C
MGILSFRRGFSRSRVAPRVYAIGDIHGRLDLLAELTKLIRIDVAGRAHRPTRIVILGDFIDRGCDSASLIRLFMRLREERDFVILKGNHEAAMCDALNGDHAALDLWLAHGGRATLASFGVDAAAPDLEDGPRLLRAARLAIPKPVRSWLAGLPTHMRSDDHYFVHAGVRPGVGLDEQTDEDRLWIGDEFTGSLADHGAVIVHGHTVCEGGVHLGANRIGVDTGAYRTGRLSAVGLEAGNAWIVATASTGNSARLRSRADDPTIKRVAQ